MASESQIIKDRVQGQGNEHGLVDVTPHVGGVPMDQFVAQERVLATQGKTAIIDDAGVGLGHRPKENQATPYNGPLYANGVENFNHSLYAPAPPQISDNYSWNVAQEEAILSGDFSRTGEDARQVKSGMDIETYIVTDLRNSYDTKELLDFGVLEGFDTMDQEERNERLLFESRRLDYGKEQTKHLLAINLMRQGFGTLPMRALDQIWNDLTPAQLHQLRDNYRQGQQDDLQVEIDKMAAQQGEGFTTGVAVGEILQQDIAPFYGAITRVITTNKFLPDDVEMSSIRKVLPGEVRQEIREWWVDAEHEERMKYIQDVAEEFEKIRKGPYASNFTRYGIVENLMGIFTPELMFNSNPQDTVDRVLGNLDTLLGGVVAVGAVAKRGTSVLGLFRSRSTSSVRNAASAAGNRAAVDELDRNIANAAGTYELTPGQVAVPDLPRPTSLRDNLEVAPDSVKDVIAKSEPRRRRVLDNLDDVTGLGLNKADKQRVTDRLIDTMSDADGIHANHRMTHTARLQNDTGIRVTVTYGQGPSNGWHDFGDLVDDLLHLDPNLDIFTIVRRNKAGVLEDVPVTAVELAEFATKGKVPVLIEQGLDPVSASTRLFDGRKLSQVSTDELIEVAQDLDPAGPDFKNIIDVMDARRTGTPEVDMLTQLDGNEFYIQRSQDRFWSTIDKEDLNQAFTHTQVASNLRTHVLAPNATFGDDVFGAFNKAYLKEQATRGDFSELIKPYSNLGQKDKQSVGAIFEWAEDYAKDMYEATRVSKNPDWAEIINQFPNATDKQLAGFASIRTAMDLQYEIFNRRLFRNWQSGGYMTARSVDGSAPNYHGVPLETRPREGEFLNPFTGEAEFLDASGIDDIYANGGSFIKLDLAVDAKGGGGQFDLVFVRSGDYDLGELSKTPLNYYAGYTMRFYEDPMYILKITENGKVNGKVVPGEVTEAIRTAGSSAEGRRFLRRVGRDNGKHFLDRKNPLVRYELRRAKNIDTTEGTLYQKQSLYREGRLFWDERQQQRLPDVNGNLAKIEDVQRTMEKGTALALRQATSEDLFKTIKNAIGNEFGDLIPASKLQSDDISEIITDLKRSRRGATDPNLRKRYDDAIAITKYLQSQMGTDSLLVPVLRDWMVRLSDRLGTVLGQTPGIGRQLERLGGRLESGAASFDPFAGMRKIGWYTFMVLRPFRQLLLQGFQISYLTGIDPTYIGTGRVFKDALALRRGLAKSRKAGFDDGWSDSKMATIMGISKKEYKRLTEEFDRSGLLDTVNVHSFNPRANAAGKADINSGRFMYNGRVIGAKVVNTLQQGFDQGEKMNLAYTYMVAVRRAKKKYGIGITELSRSQYDEIAQDASNLALAMTRPNKFSYQSGAPGVTTQFLSFSHKALLGMLGANPSLTKLDGLKIAASTYLLFGSNIFGAEDWTREQLSRMGLTNKAEDEVLPGVSLQDLLAAGMIETSFNAVGQATFDHWKDLNIAQVLAPGANVVDIYKNFLEVGTDMSVGFEDFAGPSGTPISGFLKGMKFVSMNWDNDARSPAEKFLDAADLITREVFPVVNDANRAYMAYQMGVWMDKDGDTLPLQATMNSIIARGFFGIRPEDEGALYRMKFQHWQEQGNIDDAVRANQTYLKQLLTNWDAGTYGDEQVYKMVGALMSLYEDAPEGTRREIYRRSLLDGTFEEKSVVAILAEFAESGTAKMDVLLPWIDQQQDMTEEQKQQMRDYVIGVKEGYQGADERFQHLQNQDRNLD